jgi:lysophospholipase-3
MLVEESYLLNGNKSVILMGHSMGAPMATYFLQQMSQEWKDKYIQSLMTLSGAYAGTFKSIKAYLMGKFVRPFPKFLFSKSFIIKFLFYR